jgi:hypothetical protein
MRAVWKAESDLYGWIDIQVRVESEDHIADLGEPPYEDDRGVVTMQGNVWVAPSANDGPSCVGEAEAERASRVGKRTGDSREAIVQGWEASQRSSPM